MFCSNSTYVVNSLLPPKEIKLKIEHASWNLDVALHHSKGRLKYFDKCSIHGARAGRAALEYNKTISF